MIDEAIAKEVVGLKNKNAEVIQDNKKLKDQLKNTPKLSDDDAKELNTFRKAKKQDEIIALISEGKREEAIEKLTAGMKQEFSTQLETIRSEVDKHKNDLETYRRKYNEERVRAEIGASASSVKPAYLKFLQVEIKDRISFDEDTGAVNVLDEKGQILYDKHQKPIKVTEYIESLRSTYPDFFVQSSGGGAQGSPKTPSKARTYTYEEAANLSMDEYKKARAEGRIVARV